MFNKCSDYFLWKIQVFSGSRYDDSQMTFTNFARFSLNGLKSGKSYRVVEVFKHNFALGEYIWSRSYEKLPSFLQENSGLVLPDENRVWPVGRGDCDGYGVIAYGCISWASRGVVVAKNFPPEVTGLKACGEAIVEGKKYLLVAKPD